MKRFIVALLLFCIALPAFASTSDDLHIQAAFAFSHKKMWSAAIEEANAGDSPILAKYFTWEYLKDPGSEATFDEIAAFLKDNPDWPDKEWLLKRAEVALLAGNPSDETLSAWFAQHPPQTILARRKAAKSKEELRALIRDAWVEGDYDKNTESKILLRYHDMLRAEDHIRRVDRLLWEGKEDDAKRLFKIVPYDHRRLFQARMSLVDDKQRAPIDVVNVPPKLLTDPGLLYERLRWRLRRGDKDGVRELLLAAPTEVPFPEKWWPIRDRQIREALGESNTELAVKLLAKHGQKKGSLSYREAKWLEGWIALEYQREPARAYGVFTSLYDETETPAGKSRVAYWAGRAAKAAGKSDAAHWYSEAARHSTTFYGQIASAEENPQAAISIRSESEPSAGEKAQFKKRELVQLVGALAQAEQTDMAARFILYLVENADSPGAALLATRLGREIGRIDFSVRAAKKALASDVVALAEGWPVIRFHHTDGVETPLLLSLSRQESEFFADAVSPSGALGLMQLLPSTAKELAYKNGLSYKADKLFNPDYNMTLGNLYLSKMLEKFGGSYVLAIASYNAGPGRIGQWINLYGRPGGSVHEALDWVERIPTTETRNYVQHVISGMQVYRYVLAGHSQARLTIAEDMVR